MYEATKAAKAGPRQQFLSQSVVQQDCFAAVTASQNTDIYLAFTYTRTVQHTNTWYLYH